MPPPRSRKKSDSPLQQRRTRPLATEPERPFPAPNTVQLQAGPSVPPVRQPGELPQVQREDPPEFIQRIQDDFMKVTTSMVELARVWTELYKRGQTNPAQDQRVRETFEELALTRMQQQATLFEINPEWVIDTPEINNNFMEFHDFLLSHGQVDLRAPPLSDDMRDFVRRYRLDSPARQHTVGVNIPKSQYKAARSLRAQAVKQHVAAKLGGRLIRSKHKKAGPKKIGKW